MTAKNQTSLHYNARIENPETHYADVTITVDNYNGKEISFSMPVWTPGSYLVREFSKSVEGVTATNNNQPVSIAHADKNTWKITNLKKGKVEFRYRVYCFELSVRTTFIDADHAFLHNTSLFMLSNELKSLNGTVSIKYPQAWKAITTSLEQTEKSNTFKFSNYDELADSPIEIGNHQVLQFDLNGVLHEVAMVGRNNCDTAVFIQDLKKICGVMENIIGHHPCKKYVFIIHNVEAGGGGLEHANACAVQMPRWNWTDPGKYKSFLGLCAHEYFHLWNVKRLRPIELGPFDYNQENYTRQLWVAEGITSYYDELAMLRGGFVKKEDFVKTMNGYINTLENRPGVKIQPLSESSHDAWIKEYRQNENSKNTTISYYAKGLVVAYLLDLTISTQTKGNKNLDDLMKYLYQTYAVKANRGFTEKEFQEAAELIAGCDLDSFFKICVYSVTTPDYVKIAKSAGLEAKVTETVKSETGLATAIENGKTIVKYIAVKSPGFVSGINTGDEIIAINGVRVNNNADEIIALSGNPNSVSVLVSRAGLVRTIEMQMFPVPKIEYQFALPASPTPVTEKVFGK